MIVTALEERLFTFLVAPSLLSMPNRGTLPVWFYHEPPQCKDNLQTAVGEFLHEYIKRVHTHAHTHFSLSPNIHRHWNTTSPSIFSFFFWYSWTKLAQHLSVWGADSSAWQIRAFPARRCIRVLFVCCFCLSRSCLLRWLSNPQALITQSCLSHWYGSACRQSQVWTRPKEVDTTVGCSYCSDFTEKKKSDGIVWIFHVVLLNICSDLLAHSKRLPSFLIYLKLLLPLMLINNPVNDHHGSVFAFLTSLSF